MKILIICILFFFNLVQGQFFHLFHDGSYDFNYHTAEDQHRSEIRYPDGTVAGKYAYVAPNGQRIQVEYTAGKRGYRERRKLSKIRRPAVFRIQTRPLGGLNFGSHLPGVFNQPTTFPNSPIDGRFHQFTPPGIFNKPNRLDGDVFVTTWKPPFADDFVTPTIDSNGNSRKLIFRQPVRLLTVTERPGHSLLATLPSRNESKSSMSSIGDVSMSSVSPIGDVSKSSVSPVGDVSKSSVSPVGDVSKSSVSLIGDISKSSAVSPVGDVSTLSMPSTGNTSTSSMPSTADVLTSSTVSSTGKSGANGSVIIHNLGMSGVENKSFEIITPDMLTQDKLQLEELDADVVSNIHKDFEKTQSHQLLVRQHSGSPLPTNGFSSPPNENFENFGNRVVTSSNQQQTLGNFQTFGQTTMSVPPPTSTSLFQSPRTFFESPFPPASAIQSSVAPQPPIMFGPNSNFEPQRIQQQTFPPIGPIQSPVPQEWFNAKPLPLPPNNALNQQQQQQQIRLQGVNKNIYSTPFRVPISYHFPDQRVPYPIVAQNDAIEPRMD